MKLSDEQITIEILEQLNKAELVWGKVQPQLFSARDIGLMKGALNESEIETHIPSYKL